MNFSLTQEQAELWDLLGRVGMEKFRPTAFDRRLVPWEKPAENLKLLGELGILGICIPEEFGGSGRPVIDGILAIERITQCCPVTGNFVVMAMSGPASFIAKWGSEHLKKKYLPGTVSGTLTNSVSLSEAEAGSDLTALRTRAEIMGDRCIVNGSKIFCSQATTSDYFLVYVRFGAGSKGIGAVIVDRDTDGFKIGLMRTHMNNKPWCELQFTNASIPKENILFPGEAFSKLMSSYSLERCSAAAMSLGVAKLALDMSLEYAESRRQFGRPISEFQMTQERLADMYLRYEGARLLVYKAAASSELGTAQALDSSMAKVAATEAAAFICDQAMKVFGGGGMSSEMPLEWLYRYARTQWAAGGTNDIHRSMIAGALLGRRFDHRPGK